MLHDARAAAHAASKNSKVRKHYLKLVLMNNIMRAFWVVYKLDPDFLNAQKALLDSLIRVEARPRRDWMVLDKICVYYALEQYTILLESATEEQIEEMVEFVDFNNSESRWLVRQKK